MPAHTDRGSHRHPISASSIWCCHGGKLNQQTTPPPSDSAITERSPALLPPNFLGVPQAPSLPELVADQQEMRRV